MKRMKRTKYKFMQQNEASRTETKLKNSLKWIKKTLTAFELLLKERILCFQLSDIQLFSTHVWDKGTKEVC